MCLGLMGSAVAGDHLRRAPTAAVIRFQRCPWEHEAGEAVGVYGIEVVSFEERL